MSSRRSSELARMSNLAAITVRRRRRVESSYLEFLEKMRFTRESWAQLEQNKWGMSWTKLKFSQLFIHTQEQAFIRIQWNSLSPSSNSDLTTCSALSSFTLGFAGRRTIVRSVRRILHKKAHQIRSRETIKPGYLGDVWQAQYNFKYRNVQFNEYIYSTSERQMVFYSLGHANGWRKTMGKFIPELFLLNETFSSFSMSLLPPQFFSDDGCEQWTVDDVTSYTISLSTVLSSYVVCSQGNKWAANWWKIFWGFQPFPLLWWLWSGSVDFEAIHWLMRHTQYIYRAPAGSIWWVRHLFWLICLFRDVVVAAADEWNWKKIWWWIKSSLFCNLAVTLNMELDPRECCCRKQDWPATHRGRHDTRNEPETHHGHKNKM